MSEDWLGLSKVAEILGVHPGTVRNWSNQGLLPVHRTPGGHRRYRRSEIELWVQSRQAEHPLDVRLVVKNALRNTRFRIIEGRLEQESWYMKLDDDARKKYRESGRLLLDGLVNYLRTDGQSATAEAKALGYEYASRGRRNGLDSVESTHAFLFFRNVLIESMLNVYEAAAVRSPFAWSDMFRKVNKFTDQVLITLLETYEILQRDSR